MKYNLNFSLHLKQDRQCIIYDEKEFTEKPVQISVPDVVEFVERFLEAFEEVAVVEQLISNPTLNEHKFKEEIPVQEKPLTDLNLASKTNPLKGISAKAYICMSKELDKKALERFCFDLTNYLQEGCSQISPANFLSEEIGLYIAGLREVLEIRNYLARYTKSTKKNYQNGYLYIVSL